MAASTWAYPPEPPSAPLCRERWQSPSTAPATATTWWSTTAADWSRSMATALNCWQQSGRLSWQAMWLRCPAPLAGLPGRTSTLRSASTGSGPIPDLICRRKRGGFYAQGNDQHPSGRWKAAGNPVLRGEEGFHTGVGAGGLHYKNLREICPRPDTGVHRVHLRAGASA